MMLSFIDLNIVVKASHDNLDKCIQPSKGGFVLYCCNNIRLVTELSHKNQRRILNFFAQPFILISKPSHMLVEQILDPLPQPQPPKRTSNHTEGAAREPGGNLYEMTNVTKKFSMQDKMLYHLFINLENGIPIIGKHHRLESPPPTICVGVG